MACCSSQWYTGPTQQAEVRQLVLQANLKLLQGVLPGALQEAEAASATAVAVVAAAAKQAEKAALEDGEVSPVTVRH